MKKFVFLHIQKTAGTTLLQILFNNRIGFIALNFKNGKKFIPAQIQKIQKLYPFKITGIGGHHINCTTKNDYFGDGQFTFTFLRDPVARYVSFFNHMTLKHGFTYSFDEYLDFDYQRNFQTKSIGFSTKAQDGIRVLETNFDFVGIVEQMDKSLAILSSELVLDVNQKQLNIADVGALKVADLTQSQLAKAKLNNIEDYKLYAYATERLSKLDWPKTKIKISGSRRIFAFVFRKVSLTWINRIVLR